MKSFFIYFIKKDFTLILLLLFISPCHYKKLLNKTKLDPSNLSIKLQILEEEKLIEALHYDQEESVYRIQPVVRQKIGGTLSKIGISIIFLLVSLIVNYIDKSFQKRLYHRLNKEGLINKMSAE